jgi:hypothetical protein
MSSVTRFLRQIPTGLQYANAPDTSAVFEFVPTAGNYVGNYPPGYMQTASAALAAAVNYYKNLPGSLVRDMGKTIFAPIGSATGATAAYFRQFQLLVTGPINTTQGFIGGPAGSTFGVVGAPATPDAYTNYMTFYVPVVVGGVGNAGFNGPTLQAAGQM